MRWEGFPLGARSAPVAQLDRASGYEPEGREFESLRARHSSRGFFLMISNHTLYFRSIFLATTLIAGLRFPAGFPAVRALLNVIVVEMKLRV
jgi:hypothetical protein